MCLSILKFDEYQIVPFLQHTNKYIVSLLRFVLIIQIFALCLFENLDTRSESKTQIRAHTCIK